MTIEGKPGVVLDCMIYLQATASEAGASFAVYQRSLETCRLFVSPEILEEVHDVLTRPSVVAHFRAVTPERVAELFERLKRDAQLVANVPAVFSYERDPKDESYLNLAITTGATYLVTWDRDLLDLMDESRPEGGGFEPHTPTC